MKKFVFTLTALAAVASALVSCQKEANAPEQAAKKGIKVNIVAGADTKTFVEDGDIPLVYWSEGDKVLLFETVDGTLNEDAVSESAVIDGRKASFAALLEKDDPIGASYQYSAVYPEAALNKYSDQDGDGESDWLITMPWEQTLVNGNMALDSDILISEPYDNGATRITDNDNLLFNFHRLGTVIRLQLKGITPGEVIKKIVIQAPTNIAGYVKFDPATGKPASDYIIIDDQVMGTSKVTLNLGVITATGDDVVWFRVYSPEDWELFGITVTTDKAIYRRDGTDASHDYIDASASPIQFFNEGLTKFGVNLADYRVEKEVKTVPYYEDFENKNTVTDEWTFIDADGDGYQWATSIGSLATFSGSGVLYSQSYVSGVGPLTPDNWAFTPAIQLTAGNVISFWVVGQDVSWSEEHYGVYITEENPAVGLPENITKLFEDTLGSGDQTPAETTIIEGRTYYRFFLPVPSSLDGKIVYIGFRHFDCTDMFVLNLDDVRVTEGNPALDIKPDEDIVDPTWSEDFENEETLSNWTFIDADGDEFNWGYHFNTGTGNFLAHSGNGVIYSQSYDSSHGALTPDNWAFTPGITLTEGNYLSFYVIAQDPNYSEEHYAVYITDQAPSADNLSTCTVLKAESVSTGTYERHLIKIPEAFANKTVYIGFRHFNCTDMFYLNLDDVAVYDQYPLDSSTSTSSVAFSAAPKQAAPAKSLKKVTKASPKKASLLRRGTN